MTKEEFDAKHAKSLAQAKNGEVVCTFCSVIFVKKHIYKVIKGISKFRRKNDN